MVRKKEIVCGFPFEIQFKLYKGILLSMRCNMKMYYSAKYNVNMPMFITETKKKTLTGNVIPIFIIITKKNLLTSANQN